MATAADVPLLGRSVARAQLGQAIERARAGTGSFVWISGEAGIGKTSLLDAGVSMAAADGLRVLRGTAWDSPGTPPFWLWVQVLRDAAGRAGPDELIARWGQRSAEAMSIVPELSDARPASADGPADPERFALFDSVEGVLAAVSAEGPLLLALDDLHWTDAGSLRLLRFLTRAPAATPVVVMATWRDEEAVPDALAAVASELAARSERIALGGLGRGAVVELWDRTAGLRVDDEEAERLRERTGGNPLFLVELARLARDRGIGDPGAQVPASAEAIIGRRLARVSQACHETLAVAAIAGNANAVATVATLVGRDPADVVAALDEAVAAGLARETVGRVTIAHPLIRDCLVRTFSPTRAREIHLAVADLVADDPAAVAEAAHHLVAALPLGEVARVRDALSRAADVAYAARAYEEAARHQGSLVELADVGSRDRYDALVGRGTALLAGGAVGEAREDFVQAVRIARTHGDTHGFARAALGFAAGMSGFEIRLRDPVQIALLEEALALLGEEESAVRTDVMARLSVALSFEGVADRRARLADDAVALARRIGAPRSIAHALAAHCDAIPGPDDSERRIDEATEVMTLARDCADRGLEMLGLRLRIVALLETGATGAARADIRTFETLAESLSQPLYRCYAAIFRGFLAHLDGDFAAMKHHADEVDRLGDLANSGNATVLAASARGWIAVEMSRPEGFMGEFASLLGDATQLGPNGYAVVALMPGQPDGVRAAAVPYVAELVSGLARDSEYLSTFAVISAGMRVHGGPLEIAPVLRDALAAYSGRFVVDGIAAAAAGPVDLWLGYLDLVVGDLEGAVGHLEDALDLAERIAARPHAAHSRAFLAEALIRRAEPGDAERAARLAAEAVAAYRRMGLTARAEALAEIGAPTPDPVDARVPGTSGCSDAAETPGSWSSAARRPSSGTSRG